MQKRLSLVFIFILLFCLLEVKGQQIKKNPSASISEMPISTSLLFNNVLVSRREGGSVYGLLVGVESEAVIVRVRGKDEKIPLSNLSKVVIETEKKTSRNALYSMLLGTYIGNFVLLRAKSHPNAYLKDFDSGFGLFLWNVIFAGAGGGLGYLISSAFEKGEKAFDFSGNEEKRQIKWDKFRRFVIGGDSYPKKFHLSIQAGYVFTRVSPRYFSLLENGGYYVSKYKCTESGCGQEASDFNLLRKLQITFSPVSNAEVGAALYWLGEPSIHGYNWQMERSIEMNQSLNVKGLYAVGIYKPFLKRIPTKIAWRVGIGLGAAKVDFKLNTQHHVWYPYTEVLFEHKISKTLISGVVFTELNFYLNDSLSFGLSVDYAYVPPEEAPEIPDAGIPAQKLRLGNGSIGFNLGLHF